MNQKIIKTLEFRLDPFLVEKWVVEGEIFMKIFCDFFFVKIQNFYENSNCKKIQPISAVDCGGPQRFLLMTMIL